MGLYNGLQDAVPLSSAAGVTVATGAASGSTAIPNMASGDRAKVLGCVATGNVHIKFTKGAGTCTANDFMLPANQFLPFNVTQFDTISYLEETVAAKLHFYPLES